MLIPEKRPTTAERRLLDAFRALEPKDRDTLLAFAEFLVARAPASVADPRPQEPSVAKAPPNESVVAAIKRLSEGYPMLDRATLLNEASVLMTAHVMQGRPATEVIADLETLFAEHYATQREGIEKTTD